MHRCSTSCAKYFPSLRKWRKTASFCQSPGSQSMHPTSRLVVLACTFLALSAAQLTTPAAAQSTPSAPETSTGWTASALAITKSTMITAANPLAVDAGLEMLREGGSAMRCHLSRPGVRRGPCWNAAVLEV